MYLLLQLVLLFAQITSEEPEDDLPSKEERADARLKEHDAAEGSNEEPTPEEKKHNGQTDGKGTNQPDQRVTQLQLPGCDSCCHARHREKVIQKQRLLLCSILCTVNTALCHRKGWAVGSVLSKHLFRSGCCKCSQQYKLKLASFLFHLYLLLAFSVRVPSLVCFSSKTFP